MNTIDLKVRSKAFNFDGSISRRITVIRGDSATGKTSFGGMSNTTVFHETW